MYFFLWSTFFVIKLEGKEMINAYLKFECFLVKIGTIQITENFDFFLKPSICNLKFENHTILLIFVENKN